MNKCGLYIILFKYFGMLQMPPQNKSYNFTSYKHLYCNLLFGIYTVNLRCIGSILRTHMPVIPIFIIISNSKQCRSDVRLPTVFSGRP